MIIENPDAFKSWLTSILEPLCDADPAALAKYVYALVKKDKPVDELREVMVDQLDVFLQHETKPFVEMLFKSLETNEYLKASVEPEKRPPTPPADHPVEPDHHNENHAPNGSTGDSGVGPRAGAESRGRSPTAASEPPAPARRVVVSRGAKHPPPHRHHTHEQTLVKVLPLTELLEEPVDQPPRRRDRRTDSTRDKDDRRRRRSRSWERRARARRHARDADHAGDRRHDNRRASRSPSPRGRYRNRSPPAPLERPPTRSRSRSPGRIERDLERERDRLRVPRELERDRISRDRDHRDRVSRSRDRERSRSRSRSRSPTPAELRADHADTYKRRCRDFDEKGYCMRGDLCQWDHGSDPVVLEDAAAAISTVLQLPPVPEYNPLTPDIWFGPYAPHAPHGPHPMPPHGHALPPRELIPIPRIRHEMPPSAPHGPRLPPPHRPKNFDYNRIGAPRPPLPAGAVNCSLQVKKVPRGLNDITHLNNHFSKFGKIVNIQVCYEGDPEAALITFSMPTEASVAYKSTEAVLNNRFIKVFWHNPEGKQEGGQQKGPERHPHAYQPAPPQGSRLLSHNKVLINRDNMRATADSKLSKEKEMANGQDLKKEAVKPAAPKSNQVIEMRERAQALLESQLQQQVLLIERLESGQVTGAQRAALMEAIASAQNGIENLRKELFAYNDAIKQMQEDSVARMARLQLTQQAKKPKTREEAQKEILDAELDMFTKQQEGLDVTDLAKKIAELRRQMALQFPTHLTTRRPHARGGRFSSTPRFARGGANIAKPFGGSQSVDHRPRALLISGFEPDDLDALVKHFSQYGEVVSKQVELSVPQLVLQYRSRAHAELAAASGRHYGDRTLSITWVANNNTSTAKTLPSPVTPSVLTAPAAPATPVAPQPEANGDSTHNENEEPALIRPGSPLRFDEEEEDERDEERSWRR